MVNFYDFKEGCLPNWLGPTSPDSKKEKEIMKRKTAFTMVLSALLFLAIITEAIMPPTKAFTPTPVVNLNPLPNVYVDPSTIRVAWGVLFNASVYVSSTSTSPALQLNSWEASLQWDPSVLSLVSFTSGNSYSVGSSAINSSPERFWGGPDLSAQPGVQVTSPFKLLTVTFQGISAGSSSINLVDVLLINSSTTSTTNYDRSPDVNGDGQVNGIDLILVINAWETTPGNPRWNPNCDFDANGVVNIIDMRIVLSDFGERGPPLSTKTVLEFAANIQNSSVTVTALPAAPFDEQMALTFTQNFASLAYNVTAIAQADSYGYGPAYILNGLSDQGYWYQVCLEWNWPSPSGYSPGFTAGYDVYAPSGAEIPSYPSRTSIAVNRGDNVLLTLYFSSGNVIMYVYDWNTKSAAQDDYSAQGATYFIGLQGESTNSNGFFSGLMTEWFHVDPYYGDEQRVAYTETGLALSSAWMWIEESNVMTNQILFSQDTPAPVVYSPPAKLQYFSSNGSAECSNAYEFITGLGDWWPMFHHDLTHTGYSTSTAPTTNNTLWSYQTGDEVFSSPTVASGRVYVGSLDDNVYCLDASTGAKIWSYTTGGHVYSSPAVAGGVVYVGSNDGKVYALDAATGAQMWNYTTSGSVESSPAVAGGRVYVGSYDDNVYCLDASTGAKIWSLPTGGYFRSSPAVGNGKIFMGQTILSSSSGNIICLDASTGALVWYRTTSSIDLSSPAVVGAVVYVGSGDGNVYCLDASTGARVWNYQTGGSVYSSPAVAGGRVYVGSYDDNVYCLDASTGAKIWSYQTGSFVYSSLAVAGGVVYVGSGDGNVYCLDASTGALVWSYKTPWWVYSSPAVADGKILIGSSDFKIYAFGLSVAISPGSVTLGVGQSQTFTSTVSGGMSPYTYQWYLNSAPVSGATSPAWTFVPTSAGSYTVDVEVIDKVGMQATSNTATVTVNILVQGTAGGGGGGGVFGVGGQTMPYAD